jgi:hypothetical protein
VSKVTLEANGKGHFEVEFMDGLCGVGLYDKTLAEAIETLSRISDREVKSITWIPDAE